MRAPLLLRSCANIALIKEFTRFFLCANVVKLDPLCKCQVAIIHRVSYVLQHIYAASCRCMRAKVTLTHVQMPVMVLQSGWWCVGVWHCRIRLEAAADELFLPLWAIAPPRRLRGSGGAICAHSSFVISLVLKFGGAIIPHHRGIPHGMVGAQYFAPTDALLHNYNHSIESMSDGFMANCGCKMSQQKNGWGKWARFAMRSRENRHLHVGAKFCPLLGCRHTHCPLLLIRCTTCWNPLKCTGQVKAIGLKTACRLWKFGGEFCGLAKDKKSWLSHDNQS